MINCPICNKPLQIISKELLNGWLLMSEEKKCPTGHWSYSYNAGYITCYIDGVVAIKYDCINTENLSIDKLIYDMKIKFERTYWVTKHGGH